MPWPSRRMPWAFRSNSRARRKSPAPSAQRNVPRRIILPVPVVVQRGTTGHRKRWPVSLGWTVLGLAALTGRRGRIGRGTGTALAGATAPFRAWVFGLQLLPLILRENAADAQQQTGIGLFEFGAGLRDLVDLSQDFGLVGRVGGHQRLHGDLFLLRRGVEIDEAQAILQEDVIH